MMFVAGIFTLFSKSCFMTSLTTIMFDVRCRLYRHFKWFRDENSCLNPEIIWQAERKNNFLFCGLSYMIITEMQRGMNIEEMCMSLFLL